MRSFADIPCATCGLLVELRKWRRHSICGTRSLCELRTGSSRLLSWPCWSAGWKLWSRTRAFIGAKSATSTLQLCSKFPFILEEYGPHGLRLRSSGPERLEPLSPFPIRLGIGADRLAVRRRESVQRAFPAEFASCGL